MRLIRVLLVIVAVVCIGVALYYPIRYRLAQNQNNANMDELSAMRQQARQAEGNEAEGDQPGVPEDGDAVGAESTGVESTGDDADPREDPAGADRSGGPTGNAGPGGDAGEGDVSDGADGDAGDEDVLPAMPKRPTVPSEAVTAGDGGATADGGVTSEGGESTAAPGEPGQSTGGAPDGGAAPILGGEARSANASEDQTAGGERAAQEDAAAPDETAPAADPGLRDLTPEGSAAQSAEDSADAPEDTAASDTPQPAAAPLTNPGLEDLPLDGVETPMPAAAPLANPGLEDLPLDGVEMPAAAPLANPGLEDLPLDGVKMPTPSPTPLTNPSLKDLLLDGVETPTPSPTLLTNPSLEDLLLDGIETPAPRIPTVWNVTPTPEPSPTPVWDEYTGPLPYPMLEKVELDTNAILPELRDIYDLNHELVGWITIPGTVIDYPVVQCQDNDYYLEHDFYGNSNINGQIILDNQCDPYTPSYNLILSGHHMKNGSMFGDLPEYRNQVYWEKHKLIEFDSLMFRKQYVVFAAFYSADYDENEEGFRYNANIQYNMEAKHWLREIEENQLYDTGIDVRFGDEFITLTTCNRARHRNGRFVVVCRRVREGETFE